MDVLLGVGGNDDAFRALARTLERVAETGDDLTVATLENPDSSLTVDEIDDRVRDMIADADVPVDVRHLAGDPGSQLVDLADREEFDRIVLGGGEESAMGKIRVGNVAEFVILNAQTTVTLVR
jgi:nucleotide-binding universal stress UspA family protein